MDQKTIRNNRVKHNNTDFEIQVYLTEYSSLRQEVISCLDTQRQLLSLELAVIGVAISGVEFLQVQPLLYLFGALLLGILSWVMFEQTLKVQMFYDYFDKVLASQIKLLLRNKEQLPILGWQQWWFSISPRTVLYGILSWAKFMLGFLLALSFCTIFWLTKVNSGSTYNLWTSEEKILFILDVTTLLIALIIGIISVSGLIKIPSRQKR